MENLPSVEVLNEFERLLESMEYWSHLFHDDLKKIEITHSLGKRYHSLQNDFEIHHKTLAERLRSSGYQTERRNFGTVVNAEKKSFFLNLHQVHYLHETV